MKMVCINNQNGYCKLTVGKEYEIWSSSSLHYLLINDAEELKNYEQKKFITKEEYILMQDRKKNPELYYSPIKITLDIISGMVAMKVLEMDERFRGVGDLFKFIDKENPYKLELVSEYCPNLNRTDIRVFGRKRKQDHIIAQGWFTTNDQAIKYLIEVNKVVEAFNQALLEIKIKNIKIYEVEHTPGGKLYSFISDADLECEETVICDTIKGKVYGVIKNKKTVHGNIIFKKCWRK